MKTGQSFPSETAALYCVPSASIEEIMVFPKYPYEKKFPLKFTQKFSPSSKTSVFVFNLTVGKLGSNKRTHLQRTNPDEDDLWNPLQETLI